MGFLVGRGTDGGKGRLGISRASPSEGKVEGSVIVPALELLVLYRTRAVLALYGDGEGHVQPGCFAKKMIA